MVTSSTKVQERKKLPITPHTFPDTRQTLLLLGIYLHVASHDGHADSSYTTELGAEGRESHCPATHTLLQLHENR